MPQPTSELLHMKCYNFSEYMPTDGYELLKEMNLWDEIVYAR